MKKTLISRMKAQLLLTYLLIHTVLGFSQRIGSNCDESPCSCVSNNIKNKNWNNAKYYIDKCIQFNNATNYSKTWFYNGRVYQGIYENYDTTFKITKDSALIISITSYLESFCRSVKNDSLNSFKLINDSIYRLQKINIIESYLFIDDNNNIELKETYLPKIIGLLRENTTLDNKKKTCYLLMFEKIINSLIFLK